MNKPKKNAGFTLIEMIIYIALFSIVLGVIIQLFWQVRISAEKGGIARELKENAAQIMEVIKYQIRNSEGIDNAGSSFGVNPGTLAIQNNADGNTIDIYEKNVEAGGKSVTLRKLRLTENGADSYDLSSDRTDIEKFQITDLSPPGKPDTVQIELALKSVNPGSDPQYARALDIRSSFSVRKEIE